MRGQISYDLIMDDDMSFVEGTYRLPLGTWNVLIFSRADTGQPRWNACKWDSGVTGFVFFVPRAMRLNMERVETLLSQATGCETWERVRGPDSMQLR